MNFIATIDLQDQAQDIDQDQEPMDTQVSPPTTDPYYKTIIDEVMIYLNDYVGQTYITEDEAENLEFYYDTFFDRNPNFSYLVHMVIAKHHPHGLNYDKNEYEYQAMHADLEYIKSATSPFHMYDHLQEDIGRLCKTYERLYGDRDLRILGLIGCLEQMEDKVSPNLNQVIVNRDLGRYLMGFIN